MSDVPDPVTLTPITTAWGKAVADDLDELHADIAAKVGIPVGGTIYQALTKTSSDNHAVTWKSLAASDITNFDAEVEASITDALTTDLVGVAPVTVTYDAANDEVEIGLALTGNAATYLNGAGAFTAAAAPVVFAKLDTDVTVVTNSTTLTDITGLTVALAASSTYLIDALVIYIVDSTADFQFGFAVPSGSTGAWHGLGAQAGAASNVNSAANFRPTASWSAVETYGGTGGTNRFALLVKGHITTTATAGNFRLRGTQGTAHASALTAGIGSYVALTKIA